MPAMIQRDEIPEVIVILVALMMLAIPPGIVIALVWLFSSGARLLNKLKGQEAFRKDYRRSTAFDPGI